MATVKFIVKRISKREEENDSVRYVHDPIGSGLVSDLAYRKSIFRAELYNSYDEAAKLIDKIIEKYPYDSEAVYQIDKIFKA